MDSLTHIGLGAALTLAVMGRRTAAWKAAAWGAATATLPDLDVLLRWGDPIVDMVRHRGETHALFWQAVFALPWAWLVARISGESGQWRRWWLALWLALSTHALLDAMTVYGTQLALPFSSHPYGVASVFIIDPLVTLPLLAGVGWALAAKGGPRGRIANACGLLLAAGYLAWGMAAQQHVERIARASLAAQGVAAERVLVTPTAFNSVLWRVVAMDERNYHEGFRSLLDEQPAMAFERHDRGAALAAELSGLPAVQRLAAFSHGFYKLEAQGNRVRIADLRMGQEPHYFFTFEIAETRSPPAALAVPVAVGTRPDLGRGLAWLWRRMRGEPVAAPR